MFCETLFTKRKRIKKIKQFTHFISLIHPANLQNSQSNILIKKNAIHVPTNWSFCMMREFCLDLFFWFHSIHRSIVPWCYHDLHCVDIFEIVHIITLFHCHRVKMLAFGKKYQQLQRLAISRQIDVIYPTLSMKNSTFKRFNSSLCHFIMF